MQRETHTLNHTPVLAVYEGCREDAAAKGCILFFHGLGASKDVQLNDLENLAKHGFMAVGVDNVGHGDRRHPDFDKRLSQDNSSYEEEFLRAVEATAHEVPELVEALMQAGYIEQERVGALGISMGGFITYAAVLHEPRLKAAVTLVASPKWRLDRLESPHDRLEGFSAIRLLSLTGGRDTTVPSTPTREFHERLKSFYPDYHERFAYTEYPESDHLLEADWPHCWAQTLEWFDTHLTP